MILLAAFVTIFFLTYQVVRNARTVFLSPFFFTNILFLLVFYAPIVFAQTLTDFIYYSESLKQLVVVAHMFSCLGIFSAKLWVSAHASGYSKSLFRWGRVTDSNSFSLFLLGVLGYVMLYMIRGVPVLSADVGFSRQAFATGLGFFTWFFKGFMNFHVLNLLLKEKYLKSFLYFLFVVFLVSMSGWRGNAIFLIIMGAVALSVLKVVSLKSLFLAGSIVLIIALMGVMRSSLSGHSIYGLDLGEGGVDLFLSTLSYLVIRLGVHVNVLQLIMDDIMGNFLLGRGMLMDLTSFIPGASDSVVYYLKEKFASWEGGGGATSYVLGRAIS